MHSMVYAVVSWLSITPVYCVETTELIIKQLALDCSFTDTKLETYDVFKGTPHLGFKYDGCWKLKSYNVTNMRLYLINRTR